MLILFFALWERSTVFLIPLAAALCHEAGHLIVMLILGVRVKTIEITLFGAEIRSIPECGIPECGIPKYRIKNIGKAAIYAAGGAANLLSGTIAAALGYDFFASCSFALAIINLLPIRTLDGGCIFELLLYRVAFMYADKIIAAVSALFIFLLWLTAVYVILLCHGNLSLMLFCAYMFVTLYLSE